MNENDFEETETPTFQDECSAARALTFASVCNAILALRASSSSVLGIYEGHLPGAHSLADSALMHLLFAVDHEKANAFFDSQRGAK